MTGCALQLADSTRRTLFHQIRVFSRDVVFTLRYMDPFGPVSAGTGKDNDNEGLSVIVNFEKVAPIFIALSYCDADQFGALPLQTIRLPSDQACTDNFPPYSLVGFSISIAADDEPERLTTLSEHIFTQ